MNTMPEELVAGGKDAGSVFLLQQVTTDTTHLFARLDCKPTILAQ